MIVGGGGTIDTELQMFDRDPKPKVEHHEPLDGSQGETVLFNREIIYQCQSGLIHNNQIKFWHEWQASTAGGEIFTFDPWDNATTPGNYQLVPSSYKEQPQKNIWFVVSWKMKELAAPIGGSFS